MVDILSRLAILAIGGIMLFSVPSAVADDVKIHIGLGGPTSPPVIVPTSPQLVVVPGSSVYYAPEVPSNLFFYKGRYYTVANNVWSSAPAYQGPWVVVQVGKVPSALLTVPVEYYKIPPGLAKKKGPPPWAGHGHASKKPKDK